jgi:hypothetical protein
MFRRASIPLPLSGYGLELLEAQAERCGLPLAAFMERAAERYAAEPDRERPSRRVPRFLKQGGAPTDQPSVDVELGPELWSALTQEAEAQGVRLEQIVAHAAMLLAAELDSY